MRIWTRFLYKDHSEINAINWYKNDSKVRIPYRLFDKINAATSKESNPKCCVLMSKMIYINSAFEYVYYSHKLSIMFWSSPSVFFGYPLFSDPCCLMNSAWYSVLPLNTPPSIPKLCIFGFKLFSLQLPFLSKYKSLVVKYNKEEAFPLLKHYNITKILRMHITSIYTPITFPMTITSNIKWTNITSIKILFFNIFLMSELCWIYCVWIER